MPMHNLSVPAHALDKLAKGKGVRFVAADSSISGHSATALRTANVPSGNNETLPVVAANVAIAVVDSGVSDHRDLNVVGNVDCQVSTFKGKNKDQCRVEALADDFGHTTHVAGVASGNGQLSNDKYPGAVKTTPIVSVRVLAGMGYGSVSEVIAELDWILVNGADHDIRVVNLSLGKGIEESIATDPLVQAVEQVWDAGFVVVASAGNYGNRGNFTITSPGNSRNVITVGSLTDSGTGTNFSDDYVSTYSSRGPTLEDHILKPDLIAPGNRFVATIPTNSALKQLLSYQNLECGGVCAQGYLELSGTSMAAALVSGAAALMLSVDPSLSPATIKARLMRSARKIAGEPTDTGAGVLDVQAAIAETGIVSGEALSPKMARSDEGEVVLIEDTALLWGDQQWFAGYLWANSYLWANGYLWANVVDSVAGNTAARTEATHLVVSD